MGFSIWDVFRPKIGRSIATSVNCEELFAAAQETRVRELCFGICVNMIANALSRCEFRTYRNHKEVFEHEHYLWNYEPNPNQNSSAFFHQLIGRLCEHNEALIFSPRADGGALLIAEDWDKDESDPALPALFRRVLAGDKYYGGPYPQEDVLFLKLNHLDIKPVLDALYRSYWQLAEAAIKDYRWGKGQHWKVHLSQLAGGGDDWQTNFQQMVEKQIKPFFNSNGAILPEFDGWNFANIGGSGSADTRDIRALIEDIFDFTARALQIPAVLVNGKIEGTADANARFLTNCLDPLCDQLEAEITRKRYGYERWRKGDYLRIDSSAILHFDLFAQAANIEKLIGSGVYTINDIRRAARQNPLDEPWADEHYLTLNIAAMNSQARQLEGGEQ